MIQYKKPYFKAPQSTFSFQTTIPLPKEDSLTGVRRAYMVAIIGEGGGGGKSKHAKEHMINR